RGKQALIVPDEHVFDPILTTILPLYLACTRRLGKRSRPAIEYTRDSTPHARSPFISYRGQDVVRGVRGRTAPALSVLRTCFLFRQGCRCSSLLRFDPLEVFASWPGNPQQISHADLIKPREPCNPNPSQPIDSQSLSLEIWSSQSSTSSWPSLALEESSPKQAERRLQVQSIAHMYFYPTAVLALGASPKIQFAGDKSSLHWYCDLPLHCSVLCHDTLDMPCPCPALCLVGDKTCRAFYAPSSSRASFELRGVRIRIRLEQPSLASTKPAADKHHASNLTKILSANP
ncbi:hypothetical protein N5P37_006385, partial [Trichoderma harzianum]